MAEDTYYWTYHANSRFAELKPTDEEIDAVDAYMMEVLAGVRKSTMVNLAEVPNKIFLFRCGRFGILYLHEAEHPVVADVILWSNFSENRETPPESH